MTKANDPLSLDEYRGKPKIGTVGPDGKTVLGNKKTTGNRRRALKKGHRVALLDLDVASRLEMTQAEWRVLTTIARHIPDRGGVEARVHLSEVGDILDMKQPNVSRVVANLVERDILIRGRMGVWIINPHLLYNGEFAEWNSILDNYMEPRLSR